VERKICSFQKVRLEGPTCVRKGGGRDQFRKREREDVLEKLAVMRGRTAKNLEAKKGKPGEKEEKREKMKREG